MRVSATGLPVFRFHILPVLTTLKGHKTHEEKETALPVEW